MADFAFDSHFSKAQLHRWQDACAVRFACRKFSGPAEIDQLSVLHYAAAKAELPGVRVAFGANDDKGLFISLPLFERFENTRQYAAIIIQDNTPISRLHAGIAGEAVTLEAAGQGLGSCWVMGNFRRSKVNITLTPGERLLALIPFGQPQDPEGALKRKRKALRELCLDDPAGWPNWAFQAAEAVRGAPSAVNLQPWRFSFHGNTLRMDGRGFPGVDFGIGLLHAQCSLWDIPHRSRLSTDSKSLLISLEDFHDVI